MKHICYTNCVVEIQHNINVFITLQPPEYICYVDNYMFRDALGSKKGFWVGCAYPWDDGCLAGFRGFRSCERALLNSLALTA